MGEISSTELFLFVLLKRAVPSKVFLGQTFHPRKLLEAPQPRFLPNHTEKLIKLGGSKKKSGCFNTKSGSFMTWTMQGGTSTTLETSFFVFFMAQEHVENTSRRHHITAGPLPFRRKTSVRNDWMGRLRSARPMRPRSS